MNCELPVSELAIRQPEVSRFVGDLGDEGADPPRRVDLVACKRVVERIEIMLGKSPPDRIAETQAQARQRFQELFAKGYEVTWFERIPGGGAYILQPQK